MDILKYQKFLRETNHTEKSIKSRIAKLRKIEKIFSVNIDALIHDRYRVLNLLSELKEKALDTSNQNLSNALRTYYQALTGDKIEPGEV